MTELTELQSMIAEANLHDWRVELRQDFSLTWQANLYTFSGKGSNFGTGVTPEAALRRVIDSSASVFWMNNDTDSPDAWSDERRAAIAALPPITPDASDLV